MVLVLFSAVVVAPGAYGARTRSCHRAGRHHRCVAKHRPGSRGRHGARTPASQPPPPVVGLDVCSAGPECDYGPIYAPYPTYGNVAPNDLGDCTFAAAAHWEQIVLGITPDPTVIGYEFAAAGGTEAGLSQAALWRYWERSGIGGVRATGVFRYSTDPTDVRNAVRDYGALVVELRFGQEWGFAEYTVGAGLHDTVVDGFTPEGPLVVSWGQTLQMTWEQWSDEAVGMWGIAA